MAKELFVGNIPFSMSEEDMREIFGKYGELESCVLKINKFNGKSRGYGFVSFKNDDDAEKAVSELNGFEVEYTYMRDGVEQKGKRALVVNESRPREDRPQRSFNDRGGRSGGYRNDRRGGDRGGYGRRNNYDDSGFDIV